MCAQFFSEESPWYKASTTYPSQHGEGEGPNTKRYIDAFHPKALLRKQYQVIDFTLPKPDQPVLHLVAPLFAPVVEGAPSLEDPADLWTLCRTGG